MKEGLGSSLPEFMREAPFPQFCAQGTTLHCVGIAGPEYCVWTP